MPCSKRLPTDSRASSGTSPARAGSRPDNIRESLREVRRALLEADVQVAVARDFVARVEARAVGEEVLKSLTPGQQVVGIVRDELETPARQDVRSRSPGSPHLPTVVLLAGLQGSGKTTFAGKLALWLKEKIEARAARERRRLSARRDRSARAASPRRRSADFWRAPEGTPPVEIARAGARRRRARAASTSWCSTPRAGCTSTRR